MPSREGKNKKQRGNLNRNQGGKEETGFLSPPLFLLVIV